MDRKSTHITDPWPRTAYDTENTRRIESADWMILRFVWRTKVTQTTYKMGHEYEKAGYYLRNKYGAALDDACTALEQEFLGMARTPNKKNPPPVFPRWVELGA